jgi:hypothetical protein
MVCGAVQLKIVNYHFSTRINPMQSHAVMSVVDVIQIALDRQIDGQGRNLAHEDLHAEGQMLRAAV